MPVVAKILHFCKKQYVFHSANIFGIGKMRLRSHLEWKGGIVGVPSKFSTTGGNPDADLQEVLREAVEVEVVEAVSPEESFLGR